MDHHVSPTCRVIILLCLSPGWGSKANQALFNLNILMILKHREQEGRLGGSVDSASDFGSRHDLAVGELKAHIGLAAVSPQVLSDVQAASEAPLEVGKRIMA